MSAGGIFAVVMLVIFLLVMLALWLSKPTTTRWN